MKPQRLTALVLLGRLTLGLAIRAAALVALIHYSMAWIGSLIYYTHPTYTPAPPLMERLWNGIAGIFGYWVLPPVAFIGIGLLIPQRLARWILPVPDLSRCPRCQYKAWSAATCPECGLPLRDEGLKPDADRSQSPPRATGDAGEGMP